MARQLAHREAVHPLSEEGRAEGSAEVVRAEGPYAGALGPMVEHLPDGALIKPVGSGAIILPERMP
jgi:hypothetical protein